MTTPNQSNDDRHQTNGSSDGAASSTVAPHPVGQSGAAPESPGGGGKPAPGQQSGQKSPYQDGWAQLPQREPQSNLNRPGQTPVTGRSGSVGLNAGKTNARTTADLAAKAARKEAAMVKSVGIDGPTRSIARPELVKDMPDLSEVRHPTPYPAEEPQAAAPAAVPSAAATPTVSPAVPVAVAAAAAGQPLRATVQIRRIDPWSTLKITLVISVAMFFVWMIAVGLLYMVLEGMGVWQRLDTSLGEIVSTDGSSTELIGAGTVFGYAGVIGLINVVLFTALGTIGVFIYNQCCDLVGGIQVTLADPD